MGHDQLFKEVLQAHLQAFLELFFRDVAALLDFDSLRPINIMTSRRTASALR